MSTITIPDFCEITIRRANGDIEIVNYTDATKGSRTVIKTMDRKYFAALQTAYKGAGQELLSYRNVTKDCESAKPTDAEIASDKAHAEYVAGYNRVAAMSAGGENYDRAR